jgi:hypothetical protein
MSFAAAKPRASPPKSEKDIICLFFLTHFDAAIVQRTPEKRF